MFDFGDTAETIARLAITDVHDGWEYHHDWDSDTTIAGLLGVLQQGRITENTRRARIIESIAEILDIRHFDAEDTQQDPEQTHREALCETAATLGISLTVARQMLGVADTLTRLPLTAIRFVCGTLDWAHLTVITDLLGTAPDHVVNAIEHHALGAAARYNPRSLRKRIWHHWRLHDPDSAAAAQETARRRDAGITIDPADHGMAVLTARMTDLQGAEADALITDIAATVCPKDPRGVKQLRLDGFLALLHGEHALECNCDRGADCPVAGDADTNPPRRGHLLQILITVEALLGLTSQPATLADGTPLDPTLVALLADDARWQAILTELVTILHTTENTPENTADSTAAEQHSQNEPEDAAQKETPAADESGIDKENAADEEYAAEGQAGPDDDARPDDEPEPAPEEETTPAANATPPESSSPTDPAPTDPAPTDPAPTDPAPTDPAPTATPTPLVALTRILGRGRIRPAASLPPDPGNVRPAASTSAQDSALSQYIAALVAQHQGNPTAGILDATGHGTLTTPPPGALTYKPSAATAAAVRTAYRTCTFPNCDIPSARCQLDHIVPFDHRNPEAGGWSIASNLHPVCTCHHQAKTAQFWDAAMHRDGVIIWTSNTGITHITLPDFALPTAITPRRQPQPTPEFDPNQKTWWENHMPTDHTPPTAADEHATADNAARNRIRRIRRKFRQHKAIQRLRQRHTDDLQPPPF